MKKYSDEQLKVLLTELLFYPNELRWLEWKHCNDDPDTIGKYISAIANSACLENREFGYMIWGIENATRNIIGTSFDPPPCQERQPAVGNIFESKSETGHSFRFFRV